VTDKVNTVTDHLASLSPIVILRLRNMTAIDATGIAALEEPADQLQKSGRSMLLCGALMREAGFDRHVGSENICENISEALKLKRADDIYNARISAQPEHVDS
jgi:SulP family sulfate permease